MSGQRAYRPALGREQVIDELQTWSWRPVGPRARDLAIALIESGRLQFGSNGIQLLDP